MQDFEKLIHENRAKMLLKSHLGINVTPNITRSLESFSTVPPIVNGGDWRCIVRNLETHAHHGGVGAWLTL